MTTTAPKPGAPVVGFNHNVKYGASVYHVQTEDSGLPHAHYITHLFVGGNIVASMKTSYADRTSQPNLQAAVRSLMEGQHKAMLKRLVAGEFNELAERLSATHYDPGVLADGTNTASYVNTDPSAPAAAKTYAKKTAPAKPVTPIAKPAAKPQQPVWQPAPPSASPRTPGQPLPAVTRAPAQPTRPSAPPRMVPVTSPAPARAASGKAAPLFSDTPVEAPHEDLPTLFAEELISEKSLDEVILAFLSADLEPPK
ncbi:MAG: hypothetical protein E6J88_09760 [Deltaproteobacteria bacterium]|nr:MAG: hypothetical protein E6J88_09760 [Deltaproteobacteria bacterium]